MLQRYLVVSKDSMTGMDREDVAAALRGQTFVLPEFEKLFSCWPSHTSPHLEQLQTEVKAHITQLLACNSSFKYPDPVRKQKELLAIDLPYFVATWWPNASLDNLLTLAKCALWLFMWDDEIDSSGSSLGGDMSGACEYRQITMQFIAAKLDLANDRPITTNVLITSFEDIGNVIATKEDFEQRHRFYREIDSFVSSTEPEQLRRSSAMLPSLQDYLDTRMGTSGVRVLAVLYDLLNDDLLTDVRLAATSLQDPCPALEFLTTQCNLIISLTNDILSLKKEVEAGATDSAIPILFADKQDFSDATQTAVDMITNSKKAFDDVVQLICWNSSTEEERKQLKFFVAEETSKHYPLNVEALNFMPEESVLSFITALQTMVTGNIAWSMRSKRYGLQKVLTSGSRKIVLG